MKIKVTTAQKLAESLITEFRTASRSMVKKAILNGMVTVNGREVTNPSMQVNPGDEVEYIRYKAPSGSHNAPFPVLYEDDVILVAEKPAGILTHAERGSTGTSLYREMLEYLKERSKGRERIYVVHRLDREVSGIVLFAKTEEIQQQIKDNWKETEKKYYALIKGTPPAEEGKLENWLREGPNQRVLISRGSEGSKLAVLYYKILKKVRDHVLLEITLDTGRKNQIRVQLAHIGCPVVGDRRYGHDDGIKRRIRLHAFSFKMKHPVSGKDLEFTSRMPSGFLTPSDRDEKY